MNIDKAKENGHALYPAISLSPGGDSHGGRCRGPGRSVVRGTEALCPGTDPGPGTGDPGAGGGEAQRLKLASVMGKGQSESVFVFDEPTIGLHPQDVRTLLHVFQTLIDHGATLVVIEHDLDVIRNADYIVDMGPGGGKEGGRIIARGTPEEIRQNTDSLTGRFI